MVSLLGEHSHLSLVTLFTTAYSQLGVWQYIICLVVIMYVSSR